MSTTAESPTVATDEQPRAPSRGAAIAGAAAILAGTAMVILFVGLIPLPELPSLQDQPDPSIPGQVAWTARTGANDEMCVHVTPASGGVTRSLWCMDTWIEQIAWSDTGTITVTTFEEFGLRVTELDSTTGEVLHSRLGATDGSEPPIVRPGEDRSERADGTRLVTNDRSRQEGVASIEMVATDGSRTTLVELEGPRDYLFTSAQWSPDGAWVLAIDQRARLVVVRADGAPEPRILVTGNDDDGWSMQASWGPPDPAG